MQPGASLAASKDDGRSVPSPQLLVAWEPRGKTFLRNLADLFRREPAPLALTSRPALFWPDVFVDRRANWRSFFSAGVLHAAIILAGVNLLDVLSRMQVVTPLDPMRNTTVTYYKTSEFLPAIASESAPAKVEEKGDPEYAKQRIVSVPMGADNRRQTIINPEAPQLTTKELPLPNLVIASKVPQAPPVEATERNPNQITLPLAALTAIAPAPVPQPRQANQIAGLKLPEPAIIEPPVDLKQTDRKLGELNISTVEPELASPKLPVQPQRAALGLTGAANSKDLAVPPPPSASAPGTGSAGAGNLIVLNVRPTPPSGDIQVPQGSRRGTFAATPEGRPGAAGTPDIKAGGEGAGGNASGSAPGGLSVPGVSVSGDPNAPLSGVVAQAPARPLPNGPTVQPKRELAAAMGPRAGDVPKPGATEAAKTAPPADEKKVFAGRKYYTLALNMPNLTSAGGSWVVRFAEMERGVVGELTAPVALNKVDPGYPPNLMQERIEGVVVLYAIIREDGKVDGVRVLQSVDDRLDARATRAFARWQFQPATKNGVPVALEAVVQIPFVARRSAF